MADFDKLSTRIRSFIDQQISPSKYEAPDRNFIGHRDILTRSIARYSFVVPYIKGRTIDIGCGRGYGFEIIEGYSSSWVGIDISHKYLSAAYQLYAMPKFIQASGEQLPIKNNTFDTIIAFEVIEHLELDDLFLTDLIRVAKKGATIVISTPNKIIASGKSSKPLDRFHVNEYTHAEFISKLSCHFSSIDLFGQFERYEKSTYANSIFDSLSMRWKYMLPANIQGFISAKIRPPLNINECRFRRDKLETTHTFLALCKI